MILAVCTSLQNSLTAFVAFMSLFCTSNLFFYFSVGLGKEVRKGRLFFLQRIELGAEGDLVYVGAQPFV